MHCWPRSSTQRASPRRPFRLARRPFRQAARDFAFSKYQGLGNDFILVDNRNGAVTSELPCTPEEAAFLCDRNFGVGADGVIFALPAGCARDVGSTPEACDYTMRMYNSDGSEPEMCGNGIRCLARFVADVDEAAGSRASSGVQRIATLAGLIQPDVQSDGINVRVDMGEPVLDAATVPCNLPTHGDGPAGSVVAAPLDVCGRVWTVTAVSMGNPHCCVYAVDGEDIANVDALDLPGVGPSFESHTVFPQRCNTEFVEVKTRSHVKMRVWERGAAETLACGTGACALVVAGILEKRLNRATPCRVDLPGGALTIEWKEDTGRVLMTGPAVHVYDATAKLS